MKTTWFAPLVLLAACGGSSKPAPQAPSNGMSEPVAMEEDAVASEAAEAPQAGNANEPAAPVAVPGDPRDKPAIRAVVRGEIQKIQYCYEKQLLAKPALAGRVDVQFVIEPDGSVSSSKATSGIDPDVDTCVAAVVGEAKFAPVAAAAGTTTVNYPFVFQATASTPAPAPAN